MTKIGDVIELTARKGDTAPRGTVVNVRGDMLSIRWDTGRESVIVPAAGALAVVSEAKAPKTKLKAKSAKAKETKAKGKAKK